MAAARRSRSSCLDQPANPPISDPFAVHPSHHDPAAPLADLLALAPPELAARVREDLTGARVDPDALRWPPVVIWAGRPGA
jgi:hypothetical protein